MEHTKEFILEGLDCANCANKIESNVKKTNGVIDATVNFMTQTLIVKSESGTNLYAGISNIVSKLEPHIIVKEKTSAKPIAHVNSRKESKISKRKIIRFSIGAILFAIGIISNFSYWVQFAVFFSAYLLIGGDIILRAVKNIAKGQIFDENFLMTIATIGAFTISEFAEGVTVMLFYQIGEFFQEAAVNRSRNSIADLMDIRPDFAHIKSGGKLRTVSPADVKIGDIIVIKPGEKIPLDSIVIDGVSMLDTAALTGESVPQKAQAGDFILSGAINLSGLLTAEVKKEFGESTVSKILDLVQNASSKKSPTENFITKFAKYYTPVVVFLALGIAVLPPLFLEAAFAEWINRALIFLVISCPCALVISIPLGFFGGIGCASRKGILIKGSNYLEALNNVDTVVFDKTGTLTKGVFKVTEIKSMNGIVGNQLLRYAAYAENFSIHPIALSIKKEYGSIIDETLITDYTEISGHGIKATVKGKNVLVGNSKLMIKENISFPDSDTFGTTVHVAIDGVYAGYIVISDEIKEDSANAIKQLHDMGVNRIVMLTGDNKAVGEKVAQMLALDEVYSELLPGQKVEKLEQLDNSKATKGKLVFIGDGINDAPVLAQADVGVAMGGLGSDAAIEAADVVLMTDEPSKFVTAIQIAKRTRTIVWQNIFFALAVKVIVLILGAGGIATMWEAVFADVGVALLAIINSMRMIKQ